MSAGKPIASVFVGISVDGFLARPNDALDFLPDTVEPHGYEEFLAGVDAVVIGRRTFDLIRTFGVWPYGSRRVVVLSRQEIDTSQFPEAHVERMSEEPAAVVTHLAAGSLASLPEWCG